MHPAIDCHQLDFEGFKRFIGQQKSLLVKVFDEPICLNILKDIINFRVKLFRHKINKDIHFLSYPSDLKTLKLQLTRWLNSLDQLQGNSIVNPQHFSEPVLTNQELEILKDVLAAMVMVINEREGLRYSQHDACTL